MDSINLLNSMKAEKFLSLFENIVEHTPKVAEELLKLRPFQTIEIFLSSLDSIRI